MEGDDKASVASGDGDEFIRRKNEELLRKRAELGIKAKRKPILNRELGFLVSEDNEVKEASEASKESPRGDFPPKAEPLRADSKTEIQNTEPEGPRGSLHPP